MESRSPAFFGPAAGTLRTRVKAMHESGTVPTVTDSHTIFSGASDMSEYTARYSSLVMFESFGA